MMLPGGYLHLLTIELIPEANIKDAGHDCVDSILGVPVGHQPHAGL
jgi:hypothetical protein